MNPVAIRLLNQLLVAPQFSDPAEVASDLGTEIVWGGHWKTFVDKCHFELR